MESKAVSGIIVILFLVSVLTLTFSIQPAESEPGTIIVPDELTSIQEAINKANLGDTIYVKAGIYYENVVVNKTVSVMGENRESTFIDGGFAGTVVNVTANNVVISGFTVRNSGSELLDTGVYVYQSANVAIQNNNITRDKGGITLYESSNSNIFGNNITVNNDDGIWLVESSNSNITNNYITNNYDGIRLEYSSNYNSIFGNNITVNNDDGITLSLSSNNNITENNITANNWTGILLDKSSNNNIHRNNITANTDGFWLYESSDNSIAENNITASGEVGIWLDRSSNNSIYHNNFISSADQVYSYQSVNVWDDNYPSGGNYWSDYTGVDEHSGPYQNENGSDGIGDAPYVVDANNRDRYPLMSPWGAIPVDEGNGPVEEGDGPPPFWIQWWFWTIVASGITVLAGAVYFLKRRKLSTPTAPIK